MNTASVCEQCIVAWLAARTAHGLVVLLVVLVVSGARLAEAECECDVAA